MAERHKIIDDINNEIDGAVNQFNKSIPKIEKGLSDSITNIIKDLDTTSTGEIKTTVKNLKKMGEIEREMAKAFESDEYLKSVDEFTSSYDKVKGFETKYFDNVLTEFAQPAIMDVIQQQAIASVTNSLTGANIVANVIDPVNTLVRQGIESGSSWADLRSSIDGFLRGVDGGDGALTRYTTTITNDSLNTYSRTYENYVADREDINWFEYIGRETNTTRKFCNELDHVKWFKRSDIPDLIRGRIKDYKNDKTITVPLYKKTSKPFGMKAETSSTNFIQLAGGWNCGHHAYPVPDYLVPDEILNATKDVDVVPNVEPTVDEFVPATSIKEAEQFAIKNGLGKNVDYSRVNITGANVCLLYTSPSPRDS